jgi:chromosomal replication initiation ATPase DnaA
MSIAVMKALAMLENQVSRDLWVTELRRDAKAADVNGPASQVVNRVVAEVAVVTGLLTAEIRGKSRVPNIARARHFTWFKLMELGLSASEIGRVFGVNHSSVLYGVENITAQIQPSHGKAA